MRETLISNENVYALLVVLDDSGLRERDMVMEESFGTHKEHHSLRRVKARRKETEILYLFFGIYTLNVVRLADWLVERKLAEAA